MGRKITRIKFYPVVIRENVDAEHERKEIKKDTRDKK